MSGGSIRTFRSFMRDQIVLEHVDRRDSYGVKTYGTPRSYPARLVGKVRKVTSPAGQEAVSMHTVYLGEAVLDVSTESRITLPSSYDNRHPPILAIGQYPDERGAHHTVLYLG